MTSSSRGRAATVPQAGAPFPGAGAAAAGGARIPTAAGGIARIPVTAGEGPGVAAMGPLLLAVFFASLMIPGNFALAGFSLSPYRIVLLVAFVPLFWHWIRGRAGPIGAGDVAILLYCLWIWVALFANHGLGRVHSAGIQFAEMFGGYLIGRTLIRSAEDFERFVRYMLYALLFLLPLALIELLTGFSPLRFVFERFLNVDERRLNRTARLGFQDRVQGPFPHSILFGLFCSLAVANLFYHYRGRLLRRLGATGLAVMLTVTSLSSAPLISAALQLMMIAWDRMLSFLKGRWIILGGTAALVLGGFQLLYPGGVIGFVIENLIFIPLTGYARIEVFEFGIQSVWSQPFFGIGYNEWERAFWMGHPTMDNFWLFVAVHYGIPSLVLLWAGIALNMLRAFTNSGLDEREAAQRSGYLMALVGVVMVLGTVALWGAVSTFVLTYIGAGAWFGDRRPRAARTRRRAGRPGEDPAGDPAGRAAAGPGRAPSGGFPPATFPATAGVPAPAGRAGRRPTAEDRRLAAAGARRQA